MKYRSESLKESDSQKRIEVPAGHRGDQKSKQAADEVAAAVDEFGAVVVRQHSAGHHGQNVTPVKGTVDQPLLRVVPAEFSHILRAENLRFYKLKHEMRRKYINSKAKSSRSTNCFYKDFVQ
jgi:hypothetical protein